MAYTAGAKYLGQHAPWINSRAISSTVIYIVAQYLEVLCPAAVRIHHSSVSPLKMTSPAPPLFTLSMVEKSGGVIHPGSSAPYFRVFYHQVEKGLVVDLRA